MNASADLPDVNVWLALTDVKAVRWHYLGILS
jgi:hypothetical protein